MMPPLAVTLAEGSTRPDPSLDLPGYLSRMARLLSVQALLVTSLLQAAEPIQLTREALIQNVVAHNESVQVRVLEAEIGRRTHRAEFGIFEPQFTGSVEHTDSYRPNSAQQLASLGFSAVPVLTEKNTIYNAGIDFLSPIGSKLRTGFTLRSLQNNIQQNGRELESFVGASLTQPLLKNFGPAATMARIRLAAVASEIAFQEYRKQLMLVLSQSESAYWDLFLLQEQESITAQSEGIAARIASDSRARHEVGRGAQIEVLQAEAALAQRRARSVEARHKTWEGATRLASFFSEAGVATNVPVRVMDAPSITPGSLDPYACAREALTWNPDYLIRHHQLNQDTIRLKYARNQRRPQVDLKGSYGFNGLGKTVKASLDAIDDHDHPTWSAALELSLPVFGGKKERNELQAAKLGQTRSQVAIQEAEVQIMSSLSASISKSQMFQETHTNRLAVVQHLQELLNAQIARMEAGSVENRIVLETEDKLSEARVALVEDLVQQQRALLELDLVRGITLRNRNLEVTRADLLRTTQAVLAQHHWTGDDLADFQKHTQAELDPRRPQP